MTTTLNRPRPRPRVFVAVGSLVAAVLVALLPLPPTSSAAAADGGAEDSAVTQTGKKGKYDDFSDLRVTVDQTKDLRGQGVRVSWEGGAPTTPGSARGNYLQIMQCWGDDPHGPDREQCVFGAGGVLPGSSTYSRAVSSSADPAETRSDFVPFRPANGEAPTAEAFDNTYFGPLDTNEQNFNRTFANGTGEVEFEVQDGIQADYLGCGVNTAPAGNTPTPRPCWLVVVPRGTHKPTGDEVDPDNVSSTLTTSPLSATDWSQRMAFRLDFLPVDNFCPEGRAERPVTGSELAADAVSSWQPKLCSSTDTAFSYDPAGEESARIGVSGTTTDAPLLGVTVDPVTQVAGQPDVVHAPVAVSGLAIGFFIESPVRGAMPELKLTPRLVAKILTHSYVRTVPWNNGSPTPEHVKGNPQSYFDDPEFKELNPEFAEFANDGQPSAQLSLMVPTGNSDTTRLLWNWLQSDSEARDFLSGKPDPWGMRMNSYFQGLGLDEDTSLSDFPKNDPTTVLGVGAEEATGIEDLPTYGITALDPFTDDLHDGALRTRRGNNNNKVLYDPTSVNRTELKNLPGKRTVMAVVDAVSAERYGLSTAALRNAAGQFVKPTTDTLLKGVAAMQPSPDNAGVLKPDPARAKGQAYPLTAVTYAAASVNQGATDRKAYADFIRFAAGPGQTPGLSAGELPYGYAPLPADLREQAETAADDLERGAVPDDGDDPDPDDPGGVDSGGPASGGDTAGTSSGTDAGGVSSGGESGGDNTNVSASESSAGNGSASASGAQQNVADAKTGFTPGEVLGIIRWVLLVVLFLGGAAGLAGPIMLRFSQRRTP
ncbi:hypothetical protein [Streptomyces sp. NBC_00620]|uniref:hypothetical protein n=1 Tax=Streptomyces sp. NBC_00620 TaxID=2903666 RepID=UPI002257BF7D|nr:hypothetical protein [Streptomyces sp. NBC_00620]MCX4971855.1 hypothetical protein [Streptomyces sp. NBC_00620]